MLGSNWQRNFLKQGFLHLREAVQPMVCGVIRDEVAELISEADAQPPTGVEWIRHQREALIVMRDTAMPKKADPIASVSSLFNLHEWPALRHVLIPDVKQVLCTFLGKDIDMVQSHVFFVHPDSAGYPWHQDTVLLPVDSRQAVGMAIALTELSLDSGAPTLIPGSHRSGDVRYHHHARALFPGTVKIAGDEPCHTTVMGVGDVMLIHPKLIYRLSENRTGQRGQILFLQFARQHAEPLKGKNLDSYLPVAVSRDGAGEAKVLRAAG